MSTLFITDLDGTLLRQDQTVSENSVTILNQLIKEGVLFSVATARSPIGLALLDLSAIQFAHPLVLMNGVLLYDHANRHIVDYRHVPAPTVARVLDVCGQYGKQPFVFRVENDRLTVHFVKTGSEGEKVFLESRAARFPQNFVQVDAYDMSKDAVFFSMQDTFELLEKVQQALQSVPGIKSTLYKDNYMENNWYLEVFSELGGKDNGARWLQERLGADRVVAFGDNMNDVPLFHSADVACVVENGIDYVKNMADVIIGSNNDDGVAEYMKRVHQSSECLKI